MGDYFLDSSALVKGYTLERGSAWILTLTQPESENRIYASRIARVEVTATLARLCKGGKMQPEELRGSLRDLGDDFTASFRCVPVTPGLLSLAADLAEKHALRAYDAVQLAAVVRVNAQRQARGALAVTLVSSDNELNAAARLEGVAVEDPNLREL